MINILTKILFLQKFPFYSKRFWKKIFQKLDACSARFQTPFIYGKVGREEQDPNLQILKAIFCNVAKKKAMDIDAWRLIILEVGNNGLRE